jgi:Na+/melibiose symporter-like transporter
MSASPSLARILFYAAPALPLAIVMFPSYTILPAFYAANTNTSLAAIGMVLVIARIFDAVIDPVIGHFSDLTPQQRGGRKIWMAAGALILSVSGFLLYAPPSNAGIFYYAVAMFAFYFGYSLVEISHKALGVDLARGYRDRTRIATVLGLFFCTGTFVFALAPFITGGGKFDAETLRWVGMALALLAPLSVWLAIRAAPKAVTAAGNAPLFLRVALKNKPLLRFLATYALIGLGQGIFYGLVYLYVTNVLGLGDKFAWVLLLDAAISLAAAPVWHRLMLKWEKHRALAAGVFISALAIAAMIFVPVGPEGTALLLVLVGIRAFGAGVVYVAPNALLGDVVDYELMRTGVQRAANCHALVSLLTKMSAALGGGGALMAVAFVGFSPEHPNSETAIWFFRIIALVVPCIILAASAALAFGFPLNRRAHDVVRRRLMKQGYVA